MASNPSKTKKTKLEKSIDKLLKLGLIEKVGYSPDGRVVYSNTELGNMIADELDQRDEVLLN